MKSIDIMVPYWGDVTLLKQTIDSVLAQTSSSWHLTILDDHYESESAMVYFKTLDNPKITYIRHKKNLGITHNFNYAVKIAASPYCIILGCDDRLLPTYVERALSTIGEADFYQPNIEIIDKNGRVYLPLTDIVKRILRPKKSGLFAGQSLATSLCHGNWLYFPSILWKTNTLKRYPFNPKYKVVEDLDVELNMIIDGATLCLDDEKTFQYRRFSESLSSKEKAKDGVRFKEESEVYQYFSRRFKDLNWNRAARAARYHITSRLHQLLSGLR